MKIKLDENLPASLVGVLSALGHDVDTTPQEGLDGRVDPLVWEGAQKAGRFLITQDLHFSDIRRYPPGRHHGLMLVRLHTPGRAALLRRVEEAFRREDVGHWGGCLVILTDVKVRVRRHSR